MCRGQPTAAGLVLLALLAACAPIAPRAATSSTPAPSAPSAPTQAPAPPRASSLAQAQVKLTHVVSLPNAIVMATRPGDDSLYFGTQDGLVWRFRKGRLYLALDIRARVLCCGERGFLGMTFNDAGDELYVHFSNKPAGDTEVQEYPFAGGTAQPSATSPQTRSLLIVDQPQANHNGGSLIFGPVDHLLYLALGDGGSPDDGFPDYAANNHQPGGNAQSLDTRLGKILRFDPTDPNPGGGGQELTIPPDNPYVSVAGDDLVWSYGLRNPYRMSFDRGAAGGASKGDLWIGDVGQNEREEIDHVAIGDVTHPGGKTANFGWNRFEGDIAGADTSHPTTGMIDPVLSTTHTDAVGDPADCAIISGYVYRGTRIADLAGAYVFTDLCDTRIQAFTLSGSTPTGLRTLVSGVSGGVSFGEDDKGELYLLSLDSGVWRIDPVVPPVPRPWPFAQ